MTKLKGFSALGVIAIIAIFIFIGITGFLIIDSNRKAINYDSYDLTSIIAPDEHNGRRSSFQRSYSLLNRARKISSFVWK